MKPGAFEIRFVEDTPYSVRSIFTESTQINVAPFGFLGHVFVTPTRIPTEMHTLTHLLSVSRYTGVMRRRLRRGITGSGLLYYFGDEDGRGALFTSHLRLTQGFSAWLNDLVNDEPAGYTSPFDVGTITNIGASTFEFDPFGLLRREALDVVCAAFGGEYRVNPDNTFDAGTAANLFVTNPTRVVMPAGGPVDISLEGLRALSIETEVDYEELATRFLLYTEGNATFEDVFLATYRPKDLNGNAIDMGRRIDIGNVAYTAQGIPLYSAAALLDKIKPRRAISLDAAGYDLGGDVAVGDTIAVYDPLNLLFDTSNPVDYGGRVIYPIELRVYAMSWPLQAGMGVYYRNSDTGTITDLTDYIEWEADGTKLEVGAASRPMTSDVGSAGAETVARAFMTPSARVTHSGNQLVGNATDYTLEFDTELFDPTGMHDTAALVRHRYTIEIPGIYEADAACEFAADNDGFRHMQIVKNGTDILGAVTLPAVQGGVATRLQCGTGEIEVAAGDYLEVVVHHTAGGNLNVVAANYYTPLFSIKKVAPET